MQRKSDWIRRWNTWISRKPVLPGVWRKKGGGHVVRGRAKDPRTGRLVNFVRSVKGTMSAEQAFVWLRSELNRIRAGGLAPTPVRTRFSDYAVSLLEKKIAKGEIASAKTREKWGSTLTHLIGCEDDGIRGFGDYYVDQLGRVDIEAWRDRWAKRVANGDYSPNTVNDWLAVLRVITKALKRDGYRREDACLDVEDLSTKGYRTYTFEEPNSLEVRELVIFLGYMRQAFPQHFAMTALGFLTGLRPSSLRPLRRCGPHADVLWDGKLLLVRRSHATRQEVMGMTKTGLDQCIALPDDLIAILRWHVEEHLVTQPMRDSELLFPAVTGGFRSRSALDVPFQRVAEAIGLNKAISPRAMRRTFNDLARAAKVSDIVIKSISGHLTDRMKEHYSTVGDEEQRASLGRIVSLAGFREARAGGAQVVNNVDNTAGA